MINYILMAPGFIFVVIVLWKTLLDLIRNKFRLDEPTVPGDFLIISLCTALIVIMYKILKLG